MAKSSRHPRSRNDMISALDQHQYLLRTSLHGLKEDDSHIKTLSSELRVLICESSRTEGLLWRLCDQLSISDVVNMIVAEAVNREHPDNQCLDICQLPMQRPNEGPTVSRGEFVRLRDIIKKSEAIYVSQLLDRVFTHELLIGAIAGQMGGAHESEDLDSCLVKLNSFLVNHRQLYYSVLALDAELTLQICDRVLDFCESEYQYHRLSRPREHGDVSVCLHLKKSQTLLGDVNIVLLYSYVSEVEIRCIAGPQSINFILVKRDKIVGEYAINYPLGWDNGEDALFVLSYTSAHRQIRTVINNTVYLPSVPCNFGWVDAREIYYRASEQFLEFLELKNMMVYSKLLPLDQCGRLIQHFENMKKSNHPLPKTSPFPD